MGLLGGRHLVTTRGPWCPDPRVGLAPRGGTPSSHARARSWGAPFTCLRSRPMDRQLITDPTCIPLGRPSFIWWPGGQCSRPRAPLGSLACIWPPLCHPFAGLRQRRVCPRGWIAWCSASWPSAQRTASPPGRRCSRLYGRRNRRPLPAPGSGCEGWPSSWTRPLWPSPWHFSGGLAWPWPEPTSSWPGGSGVRASESGSSASGCAPMSTRS